MIRGISIKMAYVNGEYTKMQIAVRLTFMILSLIACIIFLCKICKLPRHLDKTSDQRQLVWISIALVLFNDPTYAASIFKPSMFTNAISQLWLAIFFVLMLKYWLKSVERIKDDQ